MKNISAIETHQIGIIKTFILFSIFPFYFSSMTKRCPWWLRLWENMCSKKHQKKFPNLSKIMRKRQERKIDDKKRKMSAEFKEVQWIFGIMCKIRRSFYCVKMVWNSLNRNKHTNVYTLCFIHEHYDSFSLGYLWLTL